MGYYNNRCCILCKIELYVWTKPARCLLFDIRCVAPRFFFSHTLSLVAFSGACCKVRYGVRHSVRHLVHMYFRHGFRAQRALNSAMIVNGGIGGYGPSPPSRRFLDVIIHVWYVGDLVHTCRSVPGASCVTGAPVWCVRRSLISHRLPHRHLLFVAASTVQPKKVLAPLARYLCN